MQESLYSFLCVKYLFFLFVAFKFQSSISVVLSKLTLLIFNRERGGVSKCI